MMKIIDLNTWKRKEHFEFFYRADQPQYNICANMDLTRFLASSRENRLPLYYALIYAVTDVANRCENFRYRIRENKQVVLYDRVHPSFTEMSRDSDDDLFKLLTVEMNGSMADFIQSARETSAGQSAYFNLGPIAGRDDFLYITCIPWISFTHISHTFTLNRNDAVPRISWGKYFHEGEKVLLPFSVQVHHALVDGYHVGEYFRKLQEYLDSFRSA
ncbi:MAG: chloramphenicol acetyltransferase [Mangrovibacterium sp.]|nr:chloramphenicol acetyltransferase [Mangrovibacterium sp.]